MRQLSDGDMFPEGADMASPEGIAVMVRYVWQEPLEERHAQLAALYILAEHSGEPVGGAERIMALVQEAVQATKRDAP